MVMDTKFWIAIVISFGLLAGCVQKKSDKQSAKESEREYNPTLAKIVEAHGGIEQWNDKQTLSFKLGNQKHTIDLHSRQVKINSPAFSMGNDDGTVWMKQDTVAFEGSPTFYHSLMFYFHTMPFVLADDGINYEQVPNKTFKGTEYKGLKMSFNEGIGDAPKDEYIMYYHPDTHKMEWLAYTSTYRSQEKSNNFGLIHYKTWEKANGMLLPTELQWYQYENGEVGETSGNARIFANTKVTEEEMSDDFYAMPEGAKVDSASIDS